MINETKKRIMNGERITHFLNVKVAQQGNDTYVGDHFRQFILKSLKDHEYSVNVEIEGQSTEVKIQWNSHMKLTSQYYTAKVIIHNDVAVVLATREILQDIINEFDYELGEIGLTYFITKPCSVEMAIPGSSGIVRQDKKKRQEEEKRKNSE